MSPRVARGMDRAPKTGPSGKDESETRGVQCGGDCPDRPMIDTLSLTKKELSACS